MICEGMRSQPESYLVQNTALNALLKLCDLCSLNVKRARLTDAADLVKAALEFFATDGQLQYRGLNVLHHLNKAVAHIVERIILLRTQLREAAAIETTPVATQVAAAAREGIAALMTLLKNNKADAEMAWWCLDGVASLCAGNETNRDYWADHEGIALILELLELHPSQTEVNLKAMWALANLAASHAGTQPQPMNCGRCSMQHAICRKWNVSR